MCNREQVEDDAKYIKHMIDLVAPQVYYGRQIQPSAPELGGISSKLSGKAVHKRKRLGATNLSSHGQPSDSEIDSDEGDEPASGDDAESDSDLAPPKCARKKRKITSEVKQPAKASSRSASIEQLQERLRQRIQQLSKKRGGALSNEEWIERKKLKRKESKLRNKKNKQKNKSIASTSKSEGASKKEKTPIKPVFNADGKIVYSKFDFGTSGKANKSKEKKSKRNKTSELSFLLKQAEEKQQEIVNLEKTDIQKAKEVKDNHAWQQALSKAKGNKVKDDTKLLKKSIKREQGKKRKSKREWEERENTVQEQQRKRQEKRQRNLKMRKQQKINTKIEKQKKKGRIIPGF